MKNLSFTLLFFICLVSNAQQPYLVKDINPGSGSSIQGNSDYHLAILNNKLFFFADDGTNDIELWCSDGTAAGTSMVKNINPAGSSINPGSAYTNFIIKVGNTLYFMADDGINGKEPWKSDGTIAGTVMVKDINPGSASSAAIFYSLIDLNGILIFNANDGTNGNELWKSDGTSAGTVMIKDIHPSGDAFPNFFTLMNSHIYFNANDGSGGIGLWKTNGTSAGTILVSNVYPAGGPVFDRKMLPLNGTLFFDGTTTSYPGSLFKSDGTTVGTSLVKDINPLSSDGCGHFINLNGSLLFTAIDTLSNEELWKSDGTTAGTIQVKNIYPGRIYGSVPNYFVVSNEILFFSANDSTHDYELWKSDGTEAGTVLVKDIYDIGGSYPEQLTDINGILYFAAINGNGNELWKTEGTSASTVMVKDINSGVASANPKDLINVNGTLFFSADDGLNGRELWSLGSSTSLVNSLSHSGFEIYPNPSQEKINLVVTYPGALEIIISDLSGKTLYSDNLEAPGRLTIDHGLENGIYLAKLIDLGNQTSVTRKLVVLKR